MKALNILFALAVSTVSCPAQAEPGDREQVWSGKSDVPDLGGVDFERHQWILKHKLLYPDDPGKPRSFVFETTGEPLIRLTIQRYPTKTSSNWGSNPHVFGDLINETLGAGLGLPQELHHLLKRAGDEKPRLASGQAISWDAVTPKSGSGNPYLLMVNVWHGPDDERLWMQVSRTALSKDEKAVWIVAVTSQAVIFPDVKEYVSFRR